MSSLLMESRLESRSFRPALPGRAACRAMRGVLVLALGLMLIAAPQAFAAKLYKWVDQHGNVSYQDQPPPPDKGKVEERYVGERAPAAMDNAAADAAASAAPVVLYSAAKCTPCDSARAYLRGRGVPYAEKNVQADRGLQKELLQKTGQLAVPTIMVGNKVMQEYSQAWLESELDQAGYPKAATAPPAETSAETSGE